MARRPGPAVFAALFTLFASAALCDDAWQWSGVHRIVAVGDVHGAYDELVSVLQASQVIDANLSWTAGDTHLVSLGDLLDRGPGSRRVMDLMMRLQREAAANGGRVHVLLGNHELMNLIGDLRYVSKAEFAAFADDEPPAARAAAYAEFAAERSASLGEGETRERFDERYPPGYFGQRRAFRPEGTYGAWLLTLPALIVVNGTAFVHGGLPELVAQEGLDVNRRIHDDLGRYLALRGRLAEAGILPAERMEEDAELAREALSRLPKEPPGPGPASLLEEFIALGDAPELGADGPLWYRGSVYCNSLLEQPVLDAALERLGAARVVVGHTPTGDRRARELYGGELIMLDTGMLAAHFSGRPAALILEDDSRVVQYSRPDERVPLVTGGRLEAYGLTEADLLTALTEGSVVSMSDTDEDSPTSVRLRYGDKTIEAVFHRDEQSRPAAHELAAFALDRLLGLHLVPPTAARMIDESHGVLQLRYPGEVSESERLDRRQPLGWCPIGPQLQLMYAFDFLIYNTGRTRDNVHYRDDLSNVTLVDHDRAFGTQRRLPATLNVDVASLPTELTRALSALDEATLESSLGEWLDRREIRALLARRDGLVGHR